MEPVTETDLRLQDLITVALEQAWPGLPVIAEEGRESIGPVSDDCVLVDPLDGTALSWTAARPSRSPSAWSAQDGPVQAIVDLPACQVRVSTTGAELTVTEDVDRLPAFGPDIELRSPRHTELAARLLPSRPVAAMPTAGIKMIFMALGRPGPPPISPPPGPARRPGTTPQPRRLCMPPAEKSATRQAATSPAPGPPAWTGGWPPPTPHAPRPPGDLKPLMRPAR